MAAPQAMVKGIQNTANDFMNNPQKVLQKAKSINALTIAISNNPKGKILEYGDHRIILNTKEEVICGLLGAASAPADTVDGYAQPMS